MGDNKLLDALKCWLLMLYMIVCVVLLYLCTYKIIYIHQAHIRALLFFLCPFSTYSVFYFVKNTYLWSMVSRPRRGIFYP